MTTQRQQKVGKMLKEELSRLIREEMDDPRLGFISITDVQVSPDIRSAHIYVSVFGEPEEQNTSIAALEGARGYLRSMLGRDVNMRYTPELFFHLDHSIERGAHIFELLKEIEQPKTEEGKREQ